jgi:uncharacterized protein with HEPN domain
MQKNDVVRLRHILDAAREAITFAQGRRRRDLDADRQLNLSVVHLLEIIGEGPKGVSEECRAAQPEIAWRKTAAMRDRLTHGCFDVNLDVVWETVTQDLPPLVAQIQRILAPDQP